MVGIFNVYLKITNPIDLHSFDSLDELAEYLEIDSSILYEDGRGTKYHSVKVSSSYSGVLSSAIIDKGFDGIIHGQEIIVFLSNQIKAVSNDGSWDIEDNNIYS